MSMSVVLAIEMAMLRRQKLHLYFQDYAVFFPSLSRQLVAYILHELGCPTVAVQTLREVQDQVQCCFKTASGPTELTDMLRGEPMGGVESPLFSLTVAMFVQRAVEALVPGDRLPGRRGLSAAVIRPPASPS